jgi:hypothetical protein
MDMGGPSSESAEEGPLALGRYNPGGGANAMPYPRVPNEDIHRRGQALYDERIRALVETEENIGKELVIDVETGDYEIDESGLAASQRLHAKRPGAALFGLRIGYNAVYGLGGSVRRTTPA